MLLTSEQVLIFKTNGYVIIPEFTGPLFCKAAQAFAASQISGEVLPVEYEADTHYAGAPISRSAEGGYTIRRLLQAANRDPMFMEWATSDKVVGALHRLLGPKLLLTQSHHNCIMTKQPKFSSATGWHRDSRYWNFEKNELISLWLALTEETPDNGCLWVLPGSHRWEVEPYQFDDHQFLKTDYSRNTKMIERAVPIILKPGDLLLFHCDLFHAAARNLTSETKYALVFTYRAENNLPKSRSRSTSYPDIEITR